MSMSKKDYETIAAVLTTSSDDRDDIILQLAWRFAQENPNFRWDLFLEACDYTGELRVTQYGRIAMPGKFEAENVYLPIAYQAYLEGDGESDENLTKVVIRWAGEESFEVSFLEDNQGFLWEQFGDGDEHDD